MNRRRHDLVKKKREIFESCRKKKQSTLGRLQWFVLQFSCKHSLMFTWKKKTILVDFLRSFSFFLCSALLSSLSVAYRAVVTQPSVACRVIKWNFICNKFKFYLWVPLLPVDCESCIRLPNDLLCSHYGHCCWSNIFLRFYSVVAVALCVSAAAGSTTAVSLT